MFELLFVVLSNEIVQPNCERLSALWQVLRPMPDVGKQALMKKSKDFFRFVPISGVFVTLLQGRGTC